MEIIGAAYEEMQSKNSALLQQLVERDEKFNKLLTDQAQTQHRSQALQEEAQKATAVKEAALQQAAVVIERSTALEAKVQVAVPTSRPCIVCTALVTRHCRRFSTN